MGSIAITNATLVDATGTRRADLLIQNGVIAEVGEKLDGDTIIDADGLVVTPGFVDLHAHLREPGDEEAETVEMATDEEGARLGCQMVVNCDVTVRAADVKAWQVHKVHTFSVMPIRLSRHVPG